MAVIVRWRVMLGRAMPGMALLAGLAGPAVAQPTAPPACGPATRGQVACMAQRLCSCGYVQGGSMTGVASGWAWDCGILRPNCAPTPVPFASQALPDVYLGPAMPRDQPGPGWPTPPVWPPPPYGPLPDLGTRRPDTPPLPDPAPLTPRPYRR